MKSEKAMGEVLKSVARECRSEPVAQQLKKIAKAFVGNRVFGAPEAAMREASMWLMKKSRKVTFVDSNMHDVRVSLPKNEKQLSDMNDEEDNVYMTSIHDRYAARPESLQNMCLASFAVSYEPIFGAKKTHDENLNILENTDESDPESDEETSTRRRKNEVIKLKNSLGHMRKRKTESILRVKSFRQHKEPEKYYHSRLILYMPWNSEDELLGEYNTYEDHYNDVKDVVERNAGKYHLHSNVLDAAINDIADNGPPEIVWDSIAPTIEQDNVEATDDDTVTIRHIDREDEEDNVERVNDNQQQENNQINRRRNTMSTLLEREARKDIMSNTDYHKYMRNLNEAQRQIIMYTRSWCKTYIRKMRQGTVHNGFRIYLGGPGGYGKSFIIKLIRRDVIYFLQQTMRLQPDEPLVLLTAPTGLASFNIDRITLHSAFMLHSNDDQTMSANWEKKISNAHKTS